MFHALRHDRRVNVDAINEHIRFISLLGVVELINACGEFLGGFAIATLEGVRLTVCPIQVFLISVFDKDQFGKFAKRCNGATASAFPKGLMALANGGAQFFAGNSG